MPHEERPGIALLKEERKTSEVVVDNKGRRNNSEQGGKKKKDKKKQAKANVNIRATFVHVVGDLIFSVGVLVAAIIIMFKPTWVIADPICTFLFSIIVFMTPIPILKEVMSVLMEGRPDDFKLAKLIKHIKKVGGEQISAGGRSGRGPRYPRVVDLGGEAGDDLPHPDRLVGAPRSAEEGAASDPDQTQDHARHRPAGRRVHRAGEAPLHRLPQ